MKLISRIYRTLHDKMTKRDAARTLAAMPDYLLVDLGLNRYEIDARVYGMATTQPQANVHYIDIGDRHIVGTLAYAS